MADSTKALSTQETIIGAGTLLAMALFYAVVGGPPLTATFVIGCGAAIALLAMLNIQGRNFERSNQLLMLFLISLCIQFLHFAEEYVTGFRTQFPALFGSDPIPENVFVTFNMVHYALFMLSALAAFQYGLRVLLAPALFFIVYGMIGNAITHTYWVVSSPAYFPGFFTAQLYWPLGIYVLWTLTNSWKIAGAFLGVYAIALVASVTLWAA